MNYTGTVDIQLCLYTRDVVHVSHNAGQHSGQGG